MSDEDTDITCTRCFKDTEMAWSGMCPPCYREVFGDVPESVLETPPEPPSDLDVLKARVDALEKDLAFHANDRKLHGRRVG